MAFLGIKQMLLALCCLFGCTWDDVAPDQFITSYGYGMQDSGRFNAWDPVHLDTGDFQMLTFGLAWDIGPRMVEIANPFPIPLPTAPVFQDLVPVQAEGVTEQVTEVLEAFTALDLATRILLVVMILWITFIYRKQLGRLIPKFGNNNKK